MKLLKQRFTQWFNRQRGRKGTLWEERFKSVLVEGTGEVLATMAAYIDLNPVRAGIVKPTTAGAGTLRRRPEADGRSGGCVP